VRWVAAALVAEAREEDAGERVPVAPVGGGICRPSEGDSTGMMGGGIKLHDHEDGSNDSASGPHPESGR